MDVVALDRLSVDTRATVVEVGGARAVACRLMEMGLLPGTELVVRRIAPLGDPLELELRGTSLSVRGNDARHITVRPAQENG